MTTLEKIAGKGADLEQRLTAFAADLNRGIPEHEARGVKSHETEAWVSAAAKAIAAAFGSDSDQLRRWDSALREFHKDPYYSKADQRGKVAKYVYYFRTYLSLVQEFALLESDSVQDPAKPAAQDSQDSGKPSLKLFISHSSADADVAEALIEMLRSALGLAAHEIRCTSVDGYRLEAGVSTAERLREEVYQSVSFIGLISERSMASAYVIFELGARWGADRHLIPLLVAGMPASQLDGPLQGINALSCEKPAQLDQLVSDLAKVLKLKPPEPASYQRQLERVSRINSAPRTLPSTS
jgi:hypothetical protein